MFCVVGLSVGVPASLSAFRGVLYSVLAFGYGR